MPGKNNVNSNKKKQTTIEEKNAINYFIAKITNFIKTEKIHFKAKESIKDEALVDRYEGERYLLFSMQFPKNSAKKEINELTQEFEKIMNEVYFDRNKETIPRSIFILDDEPSESICNEKSDSFFNKPEPTLYIELGYFNEVENLIKPNDHFSGAKYDRSMYIDQILKSDNRDTLKKVILSKKSNIDKYYSLDDKKVLLYLHDLFEQNFKIADKSI